jgi:phage gpG-like protein
MAAKSAPKIEYSELQSAIRLFQERGNRTISELQPSMAAALAAEVEEVFETEGYGEWDPFWWQARGEPKPKGRRWGGEPKLLQDTGNLVGSITPAWDDNTIEAYTNVRYAKFHVTGTKYMPARNFMAIDLAAFEQDVADMILLRLDRVAAAE